jgi:hypothetical protein
MKSLLKTRQIGFTCGYAQYSSLFVVRASRNRPGVAQRVPGGLGSQIS